MIEVRSISYRYDESFALTDVSVTIDDGQFVVLAGPNGSGKTTLVRHFNGLLEPQKGVVLVNGTPVSDDLVAARTAVGMVFQRPGDQFVAATVREDIAFGPRNLGLDHAEIDRRVSEVLDAVNMSDRGNDRIDTLSGGEQARIAIAGALAMEPDHLVLDEPFAGLDYPAYTAVLRRLETLHEAGMSVIVVTHDLRDVWELASRVIVMRDGEIVLDCDPEMARSQLPSLGVRAE